MEYVQEALERQEAALKRLLLGLRREEYTADEAAVHSRQVEPEENSRMREFATRGEHVSAGMIGRGGGGAGEAGASPVGWKTLERMLRRGSVQRRAEAEALDFAWAESSVKGGSPHPSRGGSAGEGLWAETALGQTESRGTAAETVQKVRVLHTEPGGEEAAGPRALSRAFQRDARRYDGGFRLYD